MRKTFGGKGPGGFTLSELLMVTLLLTILSLVLFQVSRSFFQQYLKMENALAITGEVGFLFSKLGEDVLVATGDPENFQDLFTIANSGSDTWKLSFVRFADGQEYPVEYRQSGKAIIRSFRGKETSFSFSGQVTLEALEDRYFTSTSDRGNRVWLEVALLVGTEKLGNIVKGNQIRLARNFFPTFFNRKLNGKWIDNSKYAIPP